MYCCLVAVFQYTEKEKYVEFRITQLVSTCRIIYCKFTIIRENFIFANICKSNPSLIQHSCKMFSYTAFT